VRSSPASRATLAGAFGPKVSTPLPDRQARQALAGAHPQPKGVDRLAGMRRRLGIAAGDAGIRLVRYQNQQRACAEQRLLRAARFGRAQHRAHALLLQVARQIRRNAPMLTAMGDQNICIHGHRTAPPRRAPRGSPNAARECHSPAKSKAGAGAGAGPPGPGPKPMLSFS
jgi:hypothetical protein